MNKQFVKAVYEQLILTSISTYKELFEEGVENNSIEYWCNANELFCTFSDEEKEVFFSILKQVVVDTISQLFAVMDGATCMEVDGCIIEIQTSINGTDTEGELLDAYMEYLEEIEE